MTAQRMRAPDEGTMKPARRGGEFAPEPVRPTAGRRTNSSGVHVEFISLSRHRGTLARMKTKHLHTLGLVALGIALAAGGIHVGETDDAPGAAIRGIVLAIVLIGLGVRAARRPATS